MQNRLNSVFTKFGEPVENGPRKNPVVGGNRDHVTLG